MKWYIFISIVVVALALDLGVFNRKKHEVKIKEAAIWSGVWITVALLFNYYIYLSQGPDQAYLFLSGYLIEKVLSVDNLFVFVVVFSYFKVPKYLEHTILFWGIVGAIIFRGILIALGISLIQHFHFIVYIFGIILVLTGIKTILHKADDEEDLDSKWFIKKLKSLIKVEGDYSSGKFFIKTDQGLRFTQLFLVLIVIEFTDILFAIDSIPAILSITNDHFIVYSSNLFAILGLRSLYFVLAVLVRYFHYLKFGVSFILILIGIKMMLPEAYRPESKIILITMATIIMSSIALSVLFPKREN